MVTLRKFAEDLEIEALARADLPCGGPFEWGALANDAAWPHLSDNTSVHPNLNSPRRRIVATASRTDRSKKPPELGRR